MPNDAVEWSLLVISERQQSVEEADDKVRMLTKYLLESKVGLRVRLINAMMPL